MIKAIAGGRRSGKMTFMLAMHEAARDAMMSGTGAFTVTRGGAIGLRTGVQSGMALQALMDHQDGPPKECFAPGVTDLRFRGLPVQSLMDSKEGWKVHHFPAQDNPHIPESWLEKQRIKWPSVQRQNEIGFEGKYDPGLTASSPADKPKFWAEYLQWEEKRYANAVHHPGTTPQE